MHNLLPSKHVFDARLSGICTVARGIAHLKNRRTSKKSSGTSILKSDLNMIKNRAETFTVEAYPLWKSFPVDNSSFCPENHQHDLLAQWVWFRCSLCHSTWSKPMNGTDSAIVVYPALVHSDQSTKKWARPLAGNELFASVNSLLAVRICQFMWNPTASFR